jgi:hypothetical protein
LRISNNILAMHVIVTCPLKIIKQHVCHLSKEGFMGKGIDRALFPFIGKTSLN